MLEESSLAQKNCRIAVDELKVNPFAYCNAASALSACSLEAGSGILLTSRIDRWFGTTFVFFLIIIMEFFAQVFGIFSQVIDFTVHINQHLTTLVENYGMLVYGLIALIIFCEVGLVVAPFLPGDSMLFAIGALCATGAMDLSIVLTLFPVAAILGDNFNRLMGIWFGHKAFSGKDGRFFNKKNLGKARDFYEKYGPKAVTLCRFMPFLRTFVPFVAGMAEMRWRVFFPYSVLGGTGWVVVCVFAGYFFGNIPFVKNHFELVILTIITASTLPVVFEYFRTRRMEKKSCANNPLISEMDET